MKEKFKKILASLTTKGRSPVALFAVLKMDELQDRWTIIYANEAETLTEEEKNAIFVELLTEVKKELTPEELAQIAKIGVLGLNDHLTQSLLKFKSDQTIISQKVNGNFVHEGYIIMSTGINLEGQKGIASDEIEKGSSQKSQG